MMNHVFYWNRQGRKGQTCEVISRGKMNTIVVRFHDGYRMATSRFSVRTIKP